MSLSEQNLPEFRLPADWQGISELFPVQKESIWLNYCGTTPISSFASSVMADYFDEYSRYGIFAPRYSEPKIKVILRNYLAEILSCSPDSIGLVHNTSEGMNLYSHSISLPKGTRILVIENEYPSNVYPWEHWKEKGVGLGFVSVGDTPDEFLRNLEDEAKKGDVSLLSLSPVHWCTGMPLDLKKISSICEKYSIKLILDGSQAVGHIPVPLNEVKVEFAAFAAWKWLLGPLGLGVIYLSPEVPKDFRILFKGQASVKNDGSYFPYRDEWKPPADQFEQSTSNFNDWIYFFASLRMLSTIGFTKTRERIYEVSNLMSDMLRGLGFRLDRDVFPDVKTGIIAVNGFQSGKEFNPEAIQAFLRSKNIYAAVRLGRLRLAPHIPVTESHISRLESVLKEYLK
ncbi:aminotransferase class V-fold PLP-dependent enzyme [Leptospira idonii]|uniref:Aminotransferase class V-fold PLP-dependent enzyme n=1 Tax=Leptospira idonii TaxID=1193500 RepID=A0A4R9M2R2_9LEPT|nr:aminotransferase class V-fold PLP-dependent enzyme [Leptospira idonii]TGN19579.1 aminotransferase class V-fold PLP-dependent enzyme [Leptospira idonii]